MQDTNNDSATTASETQCTTSERALEHWGYSLGTLTIPNALTCRDNPEEQDLRKIILDPETNRKQTPKEFNTNHAGCFRRCFNRDMIHSLPEDVSENYMWHWVVNPTVSEVGTHIRTRMGRAAETARMIIASQEESEFCYGSAIAVSTLIQQFQVALTGNGSLMTPDEAKDFKWMESTNPEYFLHLLSLTMYGKDNYSLRVLKHVRSGEPMLIGKTAGNSMRSTPIGAGGLMNHREITMANAKKAKKGEIP